MRFHSPAVGVLAALALSLKATMEETVTEPKNDDEFIKQFSAKMDEKEKAEAGKRDEPARATVSKKGKEADGADPDAGDPAAGGGAEEEEEELDEDDPDEDPDADDPDEGEEDPDEKDEKKGEKDDDDSEFGKRARDAKLPMSIDDLPEEARPLVQKRLKEMESGFTRLMQKQAEFRQVERQFRTEERYREAHKVEWLASEILKDPDLEAKIVDQLEKLRDESPYREAAGVLAKDHRAKAAQEIAAQEAEERKETARQEREDREQAEWIVQRGSQVETLARKACQKSGIQFDRGVEAAIALEISSSEQGDIEDSRIREIVDEMAAERGRSKRAILREERKREVQGKTEAQRRASPLRPGQGRAGGTNTERTPKTLEENFAATAERLFPGEV